MATTHFPYSTSFDGATPFARTAQAQMEAFGEITRIGADAMRQVMQQQQDIFLSALDRWKDTARTSPFEAARVGTEIALQNASELAEIARKAQADMMSVLSATSELATETAVDAVEKTARSARNAAKKAAAKTEELTEATAEQVALASELVQ